MTISIDIRVLGSKVKSGIEEYTESLLAHLVPLDKKIKFKLFFSSWRSDLPDYDWMSLPNVEIKKYRFPNKFLFYSSSFLNLPFVDKLIGGVDVFFSPHFFLTSLSPECRRVTTFHDLSFIHYPEFFSWRKRLWHNFEMRPFWQSRFSDKIIAVSESTKNDLISFYGVDPAKIEVIYSGVSLGAGNVDKEKLRQFRADNGLPERFILFLGKLEPRKNLIGIIRAFNLVKNKKEFNDLSLVVVGSEGWLYEDIFAEANQSPYKKNIIFRDHITDKDRLLFYNSASVFVYPSFFEGFGFPPLEAITCNVPTIIANTSSLPEIVGRASLMVDPSNLDEIADAMTMAINDSRLRERMISRVLNIQENFSWGKTAEKTLAC